MQNHAAVFRTGDVMQEGIEKMESVWSDMANLKVSHSLQHSFIHLFTGLWSILHTKVQKIHPIPVSFLLILDTFSGLFTCGFQDAGLGTVGSLPNLLLL